MSSLAEIYFENLYSGKMPILPRLRKAPQDSSALPKDFYFDGKFYEKLLKFF